AAALALLIAGLGLAAALVYSHQLEGRYIHALAPELSEEKLHGMALQREAFAQPDLLVLYGSSELVQDLPSNATHFFADYPTGFRVFPVGKQGTTSLSVLQKIASMGDDVRGRKLAYSISPGFFLTDAIDPKYYAGNFSALQAGEVLFGSGLSRELRRDIADRMLDFPDTLSDHWLLGTAAERLVGDTALDRVLYAAVLPLGKLQNLIGRAQDHLGTATHILEEDEKLNPAPRRGLRALNWSELFRRGAQLANNAQIQAKRNHVAARRIPKASRDRALMATIGRAREWQDLELLMRTLTELEAKPLLLTMPIEDIRLEALGASSASRNLLLTRLDALADEYSFPLVDFREHQRDVTFLVDFSDHLSGKGWIHYNKALDDFFHGRLRRL
ncbi:MAG TPA: D-alanyl-lipoteichoic acid biosynthesis protein DltD, partial [Chthoniobacteraceae bacterium]